MAGLPPRASGDDHLLIAGTTASLCCESTGRHAMEHGYDVTFISDAIAPTIPASYEADPPQLPLIANAVLETEEFLAAIDGEEACPSSPARSSAGPTTGRSVRNVVEPSGQTPGYLLGPRRRGFERDVEEGRLTGTPSGREWSSRGRSSDEHAAGGGAVSVKAQDLAGRSL